MRAAGDVEGGVAAVRRAADAHPGWLVLLYRLNPVFAPAGDAVRNALGRSLGASATDAPATATMTAASTTSWRTGPVWRRSRAALRGYPSGMAEPTSWFTIQEGWEVADRAGVVIGEVLAVVGDENADIFDGLRFETEGGDERFAPGERVAEIVEGRVTLDAEMAELGESPSEEEPGGAEITRDRDAEL